MNQKVLDFIRASVEEKLKNRYVSTLEQSSIDSEEESKIVILFTANGIREGHSENICHNCAGADKDCPDCGGNGFY